MCHPGALQAQHASRVAAGCRPARGVARVSTKYGCIYVICCHYSSCLDLSRGASSGLEKLQLLLAKRGNERTRHHPAGERSQRNTPQSCCLIMEPCDATQFYNRRKVRQGDGGGILSAAPLAPIRHWPTPSPGTPKFWRSARST